MSGGWDQDDEDEDENGDENEEPNRDVHSSIHEVESDFELVPIDEAKADTEGEGERIQLPFAEFQYEPYSIEANGPPVCPLCGQQLSMVRIDDPETAVVSPCGCRLPPDPFFEQ